MRDLPFDAPAVERGVGFFETVLLIDGHAAHWVAHVQRLLGTLARFELPAPGRDHIHAEAMRAVAISPAGEHALRLTWLALGKALDDAASWRLDISTRPIPPATLARRAGSHAVTLAADLVRDTPSLKSTSYLSSVLGLREAMRRGGDEGLFTDRDGSYLEGTAAALLAWRDGRLLAARGAVLPSVTAGAFIGGETVEHGTITRDDLCAGAVLLGSLTRAAPLLSVDGIACNVPPAMAERIRHFNAAMQATATRLLLVRGSMEEEIDQHQHDAGDA